MAIRVLEGDPDCDEILGWLDAHSVTVAQGLPAHFLHTKWQQAGRPPGRLGACLQRLFESGWIAITPVLDPPHLRFTVDGYRRLLEPPQPAAPPPPPADIPEPEDAQVRDADRRYVSHGRPLTEAGLRNQILSVYRELRLKADNRLIGVTLSRYWQEMGLRAGDLRTGLDVLVRDGYLRQRIDGIDRYWVLTAEGEAFIQAPPTHEALMRLSPPLEAVQASPPPAELRHLVLHLFAGLAAGGERDYPHLREHWQCSRVDDNGLLHGLDLLLKEGLLELHGSDPPRLRLTAAGEQLARRETAGLARLWARLARVLGP